MATTYCVNADLVLDNGKPLLDFVASGLTSKQRTLILDNARLKAYNMINAHER